MIIVIGIVIFLVLAVLVAIGGLIQGHQNSTIKRAQYKMSKEYLRLEKERLEKKREQEKNL